jgi:hypothetical protein
MTRQEIIDGLDKMIAPHVDAILRAAQSGNKQLLEKAIKNAAGPLSGLYQAREHVSLLPEE